MRETNTDQTEKLVTFQEFGNFDRNNRFII